MQHANLSETSRSTNPRAWRRQGLASLILHYRVYVGLFIILVLSRRHTSLYPPPRGMRFSLQCLSGAFVALAIVGIVHTVEQMHLQHRTAAAAAAASIPCPPISAGNAAVSDAVAGATASSSPPPLPSATDMNVKPAQQTLRGLKRFAREVTAHKWKDLPEAEKEAYLQRNYGSVDTPAFAAPARRRDPWLAVIGFPVGIDQRNYDRRALLRELWYPEYPNLDPAVGTIRCEFIIGLLTYQAEGHDEATVKQLHDEQATHGDLALVNAREATRDPYRGDPKCTGEKIIAWFQQVVVMHRGTRYFIKADWDTWIHTTRLEHNLLSLLHSRTGARARGEQHAARDSYLNSRTPSLLRMPPPHTSAQLHPPTPPGEIAP